MGTNKSFPISISYKFTSDNEFWRNQIDEGIDAPEVTGGMITTPSEGHRKSKAAVIGGVFLGGTEAPAMAEENSRKIIDSLLPGEIQDKIMDLVKNYPAVVADLEFFATNIARSEYQKVAAETSDNPEEAHATEEVIKSIQVKITITGVPTEDEIFDWVSVEATRLVENALKGGGAS